MMVTLMPSGGTSAASLGEPAYGELGQLVGAEGRGSLAAADGRELDDVIGALAVQDG
jgi:hypothetical protein